MVNKKTKSQKVRKPPKRKLFVICLVVFAFIMVGLLILNNVLGGPLFSIIANVIHPERPYTEFDEPLFDVSVSVEHEEVDAGEDQIVITKIINMGIEEAKDVVVKYSLWDEKRKNKISESSESIAVQTSMALVRKIYIPEGLSGGDYIIDVEVEYRGQKAKANSTFIVKGEPLFFSYEIIIIGIGIFISLALVYLIYILKKRTRKNEI